MSPASSGPHIGYHRKRQPSPPPFVVSIDAEVETLMRDLIVSQAVIADGECQQNQGGAHQVIASCGMVVCGACARVFWR